MKRHLLALVLLVFAAVSQAADVTMTVTTDPPPPWSATEPVVLRMTFTNHANEARRGWFELYDFRRTAGLVQRLDVRAESAAGLESKLQPYPCREIGPTGEELIWCSLTVPIPAGESLVLTYDVMAFPNAVGYRDATFELYPMTADTIFHVPDVPAVNVPVRFAYGFVPDVAVPGLGAYGVLLLGLGLLLAASWRMYGATPSQGLKS